MESLEELKLPGDSTPLNKEKKVFYKDAAEYWSQIPPTVDGMLGGFGFISNIDIQGSSLFLKSLFQLKKPPGKANALDCGAGIGRITKSLLLNFFDKVDVVEQNPAFVRQAQAAFGSNPKMGRFFCSGLQDFLPEPNSYDVIWCQWVLGHLTDDDLIKFLHACKCGLKINGVIVIKENVSNSKKLIEDEVDSSVTRPLSQLCRVIEEAGLQRIKHRRQKKFPDVLFPVYMIAACPMKSNEHPSASGSFDNEYDPLPCLNVNSQESSIPAFSEFVNADTSVERMPNVRVQSPETNICSSSVSPLQCVPSFVPKSDLTEVPSAPTLVSRELPVSLCSALSSQTLEEVPFDL